MSKNSSNSQSPTFEDRFGNFIDFCNTIYSFLIELILVVTTIIAVTTTALITTITTITGSFQIMAIKF